METLLVSLAQRIREEFEEDPGLRMTIHEASRFWGLDEKTCSQVLAQLLETRNTVLRMTRHTTQSIRGGRLKVGSDAMSRTDWFELDVRAPVDADLRHRIQALLGRGERRILLNLAGVSDLDAAGLGELVRAYNMAAAANGVLRVARTFGRVRELLRRVGLFDLLDVDSERVLEEEISRLSDREKSIGQSRVS